MRKLPCRRQPVSNCDFLLSEVDTGATHKLGNWATTKGSCSANTKSPTKYNMQVHSDEEKANALLSEVNQKTTN